MWSYLGAMTLLGGLGFDPGPMIISVGALSLGARRRNILLFATALVLGTTAWGVALNLVAGPAIRHVHWLALAESPLGLGVAAVAAGVLLVWGILTLRRRLTPRGPGWDPDRARQETRTASHIAAGPLPLLLVALFFVAIVLSTPRSRQVSSSPPTGPFRRSSSVSSSGHSSPSRPWCCSPGRW